MKKPEFKNMKDSCDAKGCEKESQKNFRNWKLCLDHYTSVAYDMVPLILKHQGQRKLEERCGYES